MFVVLSIGPSVFLIAKKENHSNGKMLKVLIMIAISEIPFSVNLKHFEGGVHQ